MCDARNLNCGKIPLLPRLSLPTIKTGERACAPQQAQQLSLFAGQGLWTERKSLLCFLQRTATYPSQCQSQTVCPVNLSAGCEPVRGLDSDCSDIYPRSQRPVGKENAIRQAGQVLATGPASWEGSTSGQVSAICRLPLSLCLEAGGASGAQTGLAKVSVTCVGL